MKVLSLFDGMSCGMLAMLEAGVKVDRYVAYEIDKYAVRTSSHNFPMIEQRGDVFQADFTEFAGFDLLVGGSPCTYWSIAQTKNRETVASGMGWELFRQYVRALHEAKPKYFIYENNKSMSKAIRASIDETFGFEAVLINSALVSAQNRQRLYWVGKRNPDGTYSKVDVEQPADRGILLKDVLDSVVARDMVAEPVCLRYERTDEAKRCRKAYEAHEIKHGYNELNELHPRPDGKTNTLTTVLKDNQIMKPINVPPDCDVVITENSIRYQRRDQKHSTVQGSHVNFTDVKSQTLSPTHIPNVIEPKSGKTHQVYEVRNGLITIKGKQYPIKLQDGYYIIRKLTVRECMRLQTVPEWYEFPVSDSQAYKMLGNGWTVDVIAHILKGLKEAKKIPDINEPMCIPITNIQLEKMEAKEDGKYENWID